MLKLLAVFTGGGLGALLRFLVGFYCKNCNISVVVATFSVNLIGSFIIGFVLTYSILKSDFSPTVLTIGFCGGLTTFSTFSAECLDFLLNGKILAFLLYTLLSVSVCVIAAGLGVYLAKNI